MKAKKNIPEPHSGGRKSDYYQALERNVLP